MRKRIDVLENKVKELELKCRSFARQFEILIHQTSHDCEIIQSHELTISRLKAMLMDDYK